MNGENGQQRTTIRKKHDFGRWGLLNIRFLNHGGPPFFKLHLFWGQQGLFNRRGLLILMLTLFHSFSFIFTHVFCYRHMVHMFSQMTTIPSKSWIWKIPQCVATRAVKLDGVIYPLCYAPQFPTEFDTYTHTYLYIYRFKDVLDLKLSYAPKEIVLV